ncbi:hypothetical protein SUGI_0277300 [Cryptomeria japonica]|nr:hypothetical protein SUGI_0277300 [Cryptomeria japonica]
MLPLVNPRPKACILGMTPRGSLSACVVLGLGGSPVACVVPGPAPGDVLSCPATDGGGAAKRSYADQLGKETFMSSCSIPSASLQVLALGASTSVGGTDVSRSSNGTTHVGDVSGVDCSTFRVSRGSYADRLTFGRGVFGPVSLDSMNGSLCIGKPSFRIRFRFFLWENRFPLMIKPWYEDLNPSYESFCKMSIWVRLPNLPLHLWVDQLLEEVGEALGDFLMVDVESFDILHPTYARILVDIDASKGLPTEIKLSTPKGLWIQPLNYEGIPFRCRRYFKTGHVAAKCYLEKVKVKKPSSWWKGASSQHYMVFKSSSQMVGHDLPINGSNKPAVDSVGSIPLVPGTGSDTPSMDVVDGVVPSADVSNGAPTMIPSEPSGGLDILQIVGSTSAAGDDRTLDGTSVGAAPIPVSISASVSASDASAGVVPLSVSSSRNVPGLGSAGLAGSLMFAKPSLGAGFHVLDSLEWQAEAAKVEEGWISVKCKHSKRSSPSFDMTLRSQKKGSKGKS